METAQAGGWVKVRCTVLKDGQPIRDRGSYGPLGRLVPSQFRLVAGAGASEPALLAAVGQTVMGMRVGEVKSIPWDDLTLEVGLLQIGPVTPPA